MGAITCSLWREIEPDSQCWREINSQLMGERTSGRISYNAFCP